MKRQINLKEISDGRLYDLNDMVKADCHDCEGCSACCQGMGNSVVLDPLDTVRIQQQLQCNFADLLIRKVELNVVDGIVLPNLKMGGQKDGTESCAFLDYNGRCSIHPFRPGICRIFPLGRYYENHLFRYFLQTHECHKENRTKVKVHKWIDTPNPAQYEQYIIDWHYMLTDMEDIISRIQDDEVMKSVSMYVLTHFYFEPYSEQEDFYIQFYKRHREAHMFMEKW